jgi:hypothetical protein
MLNSTSSRRCEWFHLCTDEATTTRLGPILGSPTGWGEIPICDRCNDKIAALEIR